MARDLVLKTRRPPDPLLNSGIGARLVGLLTVLSSGVLSSGLSGRLRWIWSERSNGPGRRLRWLRSILSSGLSGRLR
jgi:hypothetical protein